MTDNTQAMKEQYFLNRVKEGALIAELKTLHESMTTEPELVYDPAAQRTDLSVPTVHLNGTSRQELMNQLLNAMQAIDQAIKVCCQAAPHGRDYYTQPGDALHWATRQHCDRLNRLEAVRDEYDLIAQRLSESEA